MRLTPEDFRPWPEPAATDAPGRTPVGWWMFALKESHFPGMSYLWDQDRNRSLCPITSEIVESIPGVTDAGFSALLPNTWIKPHVGLENHLFRAHLGIIVPEPELCVLEVDGEQKRWSEGEAFVFDDTFIHEAFNDGQAIRIVLMLCVSRAAYGFADSPA